VIKILLTAQFTLAMINIMAWAVFSINSRYFENSDPGFRLQGIINVPLHTPSAYQVFRTGIEQNPNITGIAGTQSIFGHSPRQMEAGIENEKKLVWCYSIGTNYLKISGVNILEGRDFATDLASDQSQSIIVNQRFCQVFGLDSAPGKRVSLYPDNNKRTYTIIGVVNDFRIRDVDEPVEPALFVNIPETEYSTMAVRFDESRYQEIMASLAQHWQSCFPNLPFQGWPLENIRAHEVHIAQTVSTVFGYISVLTMIIIAMGLFALIALNIEKRTKEIAVHKILGASLLHISKLLMKESFYMFLISIIISAVAGTYFLSLMLQSMWKEYLKPGALPVIYAAAMFAAIAVTTLAVHLLRIRNANPIDALRYE
jgi:ABC-type antimicrobial peptide transport system permease subunit